MVRQQPGGAGRAPGGGPEPRCRVELQQLFDEILIRGLDGHEHFGKSAGRGGAGSGAEGKEGRGNFVEAHLRSTAKRRPADR